MFESHSVTLSNAGFHYLLILLSSHTVYYTILCVVIISVLIFFLTVPVEVLMDPVNATVNVGEVVTFNCSFDGYPYPSQVSLEEVCVCVCVCVAFSGINAPLSSFYCHRLYGTVLENFQSNHPPSTQSLKMISLLI